MRRSWADHVERGTPVRPVTSTGRSTQPASMRCVETSLPLSTVAASTASPDAEGWMHTIGPVAGAGANADSPAGESVQQPIQPCHFGPTFVCCARPTVDATVRMPRTATQRFIVTFIVFVLMDEA